MRGLLAPLAAAAALAAAPGSPPRARAQTDSSIEPVSGQPEEDAAARDLSERLASDPGLRADLARRIWASSLGPHFPRGVDRTTGESETAGWIKAHPADAAHMALGFAQDDADGTRNYETSLYVRYTKFFELNPNRYNGILGRLNAAGDASKGLIKQTKMPEEQQRELIKRFFEGQGAETSRTLSGPDDGGAGRPAGPGGGGASGGLAAFAGSGLYDRLSASNLTGYSPQVQSYQSALNQQRVPGAPHLAETGKLDEPTLVQPFYALRLDADRLGAALRLQTAWALARLLGREREFTEAQLASPSVLDALRRAAAGRSPGPRYERRRQAVDRASQAAEAFRAEAQRARDPAAITPAFLRGLGARRLEAARWITVAGLEAELQRLENDEGFWTAELQEAVRTAPTDEAARQAYLQEGSALNDRLARAEDLYRRARDEASAPDYAARGAEIDRTIARARLERGELDRDVAVVATVPFRLRAAFAPLPAWKLWLRRWVIRLFPDSRWAKGYAREDAELAALRSAFALVGAGEFAAARRSASEAL